MGLMGLVGVSLGALLGAAGGFGAIMLLAMRNDYFASSDKSVLALCVATIGGAFAGGMIAAQIIRASRESKVE